jgi:hypothetical protein
MAGNRTRDFWICSQTMTRETVNFLRGQNVGLPVSFLIPSRMSVEGGRKTKERKKIIVEERVKKKRVRIGDGRVVVVVVSKD